jgi:hypothetical protein
MERGGGVHTVPVEGEGRNGWWNKMNGEILSRHRVQRIAVAAGREFARRFKVEHTIHGEDGEISEKNSYGNDSFPPRG